MNTPHAPGSEFHPSLRATPRGSISAPSGRFAFILSLAVKQKTRFTCADTQSCRPLPHACSQAAPSPPTHSHPTHLHSLDLDICIKNLSRFRKSTSTHHRVHAPKVCIPRARAAVPSQILSQNNSTERVPHLSYSRSPCMPCTHSNGFKRSTLRYYA